MFQVPLLHVGIALIVDVVKRSTTRDKVGGIVVDVQPSRVQKAAHGLHLFEPVGFHPSLFEKLRHRLPGDVLLQNVLLQGIHRQEPRHGDTELAQRFIVVQLSLQLVTEGVVFTRLMVDLLQDILCRSICHQIGVADFSFPKELDHGIFGVVYRQCATHRSVHTPFPLTYIIVQSAETNAFGFSM